MKGKSYFNNYWVGVVKNGWHLKDCGILKPGMSHEWFDELSRLIEWFLHADSEGITFCCTLYLWHLNAGGPLQLYLARVFRKNSLCAKIITRKGFDLTGSDLGFTMKFWITMTELFVTMNSFTISGRNVNGSVSFKQYVKVMLPNFAKDHCFWTLWTLNYVDCIRFSCIDYFQILFSNFQKTWLNLQLCGWNPIKSVLFICPFVCLSVMHFPQDLLFGYFWFFAWGCFAIYTKKWPSDNLFVV